MEMMLFMIGLKKQEVKMSNLRCPYELLEALKEAQRLGSFPITVSGKIKAAIAKAEGK